MTSQEFRKGGGMFRMSSGPKRNPEVLGGSHVIHLPKENDIGSLEILTMTLDS